MVEITRKAEMMKVMYVPRSICCLTSSLTHLETDVKSGGSVLNAARVRTVEYPDFRVASRYLSRQLVILGTLTKLSNRGEPRAQNEVRRRIYVLLCRSRALTTLATVLVLAKTGSRGFGYDYTREEVTNRTIGYIRKEVHWRLFGLRVCGTSKRVWIPKVGGEWRGIAVPTQLDKITQQVIRLLLEVVTVPLQSSRSVGFRIGNSRDQGLSEFLRLLRGRYKSRPGYKLLDVDLRKWFDTIPHGSLRALIGTLPLPASVRVYLNSTLIAEIRDDKGHPMGESPKGVMTPTQGTPQGGVLSPLLSNLIATPLDRYIESQGLLHVRYADNLVIGTPPGWGVSDKEAFKRGMERVLPEGTSLHPKKERWSNVLATLGYYINTLGEGLYQSYHKYEGKAKARQEEVRTTHWSSLGPKVRWYKGLGIFRESRLSLTRLYSRGTILWNPWELLNRDWLSPLEYDREVILGGGQTLPGNSGVPYLHDYTGYINSWGRTNSYWNASRRRGRVGDLSEDIYHLYRMKKAKLEGYRQSFLALK
jgi:retron-type reverse transcriptase